MGGNDYMRKPFSMVELLVRIESLLFRFGKKNGAINRNTEEVYRIGTGVFDFRHQKLLSKVNEQHLSYKELRLLKMLVEQKMEVCHSPFAGQLYH